MERKWSLKFDSCKNCLTNRFPHKAKGYCSRCYFLTTRLIEIELWDFEKPKTLKHYPKDQIFYRLKTFEKIKKGSLKQYKERLDSLKYIEESLNKPISGHDLEYKIRNVAKLAGVDEGVLFYGSANSFNRYFDEGQRKILYEFLNRITESPKWKGVDWYRIFQENYN